MSEQDTMDSMKRATRAALVLLAVAGLALVTAGSALAADVAASEQVARPRGGRAMMRILAALVVAMCRSRACRA